MRLAFDSDNISKRTAIIIGLILGVSIFLVVVYIYRTYYHDYWQEVYNGEVRANRKSRIYHLPHCSSYNNVGRKNLRTYKTVKMAEKLRFRLGESCPAGVIEARRIYENKNPQLFAQDEIERQKRKKRIDAIFDKYKNK